MNNSLTDDLNIKLLELDELIVKSENQAKTDSEFRNNLASIDNEVTGICRKFITCSKLHSDEFINQMSVLHDAIIQKKYTKGKEGLPNLNVEWEKDWHFPYGTKSYETIGCFFNRFWFYYKEFRIETGRNYIGGRLRAG